MRFAADYYDADYFVPGSKSGYCKPFTWENEGEERMRRAEVLIRQFQPVRVLDVGCANGMLVKALRLSGVDAFGCDISEWAVDTCEPEARGYLSCFDIRSEGRWPYPDNSFDLVASLGTLEHIDLECLGRVLGEISRVTSKWAFISVPVSLVDRGPAICDPSHVTNMTASFWVAAMRGVRLIWDPRRTLYINRGQCQELEAGFHKGGLPIS